MRLVSSSVIAVKSQVSESLPSSVTTQSLIDILVSFISPSIHCFLFGDREVPTPNKPIPVFINLWARRSEQNHIFRPRRARVYRIDESCTITEKRWAPSEPKLLKRYLRWGNYEFRISIAVQSLWGSSSEGYILMSVLKPCSYEPNRVSISRRARSSNDSAAKKALKSHGAMASTRCSENHLGLFPRG